MEYQDEIIAEKEQLDERAERLSSFIGTSLEFEKLAPEEQARMKQQADLMWQLSEVLGARIENIQTLDNQDAEGKLDQALERLAETRCAVEHAIAAASEKIRRNSSTRLTDLVDFIRSEINNDLTSRGHSPIDERHTEWQPTTDPRIKKLKLQRAERLVSEVEKLQKNSDSREQEDLYRKIQKKDQFYRDSNGFPRMICIEQHTGRFLIYQYNVFHSGWVFLRYLGYRIDIGEADDRKMINRQIDESSVVPRHMRNAPVVTA